jgi:hypothetical protein
MEYMPKARTMEEVMKKQHVIKTPFARSTLAVGFELSENEV